MTTCNNYYNLNLFDTNCRNSLILDLSTRISTNTTDIWKNMHKTVLIKKQTEKNNEFSNPSNNDRISGKADVLPGQLISIINRDIHLKFGFSHSLDLLPRDSDFKMVCDYIYLFLLIKLITVFNY